MGRQESEIASLIGKVSSVVQVKRDSTEAVVRRTAHATQEEVLEGAPPVIETLSLFVNQVSGDVELGLYLSTVIQIIGISRSRTIWVAYCDGQRPMHGCLKSDSVVAYACSERHEGPVVLCTVERSGVEGPPTVLGASTCQRLGRHGEEDYHSSGDCAGLKSRHGV